MDGFAEKTGKHNLTLPLISGNLNAAEEEDSEYGLRGDIHRVPLIFMRHEALQRRCRLACKLLGIWLGFAIATDPIATGIMKLCLYLVARMLQAC